MSEQGRLAPEQAQHFWDVVAAYVPNLEQDSRERIERAVGRLVGAAFLEGWASGWNRAKEEASRAAEVKPEHRASPVVEVVAASAHMHVIPAHWRLWFIDSQLNYRAFTYFKKSKAESAWASNHEGMDEKLCLQRFPAQQLRFPKRR